MKFQKGIASIILEIAVVAILLGAFIFASPKFKNTLQPTPSPVVSPSPSPIDETANWKTYTNKEIGILFRYPSEWGNLRVGEEQCLPEQGPTRVYQNQPCVHITLSAGVAENPAFLAAQSKLFSRYIPGRGAYWADWFSLATNYSGITPESYVKNYCADDPASLYRCSVQTNPNGVLYSKSLENEDEIESTRKALYYSILNHNKNFPVILMSNTEFLDSITLDDSEMIFDQILSTFRFSDDETVDENQTVCAQVITPARNQTTGECKVFPTPCDVPNGWTKVSSC